MSAGWQALTVPWPTNAIPRQAVTQAGELYVVTSTNATVWRTADLENWTEYTYSLSHYGYGLAYGDGTWMTCGTSGRVYRSTDLINWTISTLYSTLWNAYGVAYGDGTWVVVGDGGHRYYSTNGGANWTKNSGPSTALKRVTYADGLWVEVGGSGILRTSPDGINWTTRSTPTTKNLEAVTYGDGVWIAVGADGTILRSTNGTSWTLYGTGASRELYDVGHADGMFVIASDSGDIPTSPDGIIWTIEDAGANTDYDAIGNLAGRWVVAGYGGSLVGSYNAAPNAPVDLDPAGAAIDRTTTVRFAWTFSDPDVGDTQSRYRLEARIQGTETWTYDATVDTPTAHHDVPAGTFTEGAWEWRVRTWDAAGVEGPPSDLAAFDAVTPPPAPTIVAPAVGETISVETYLVEWSTPAQDAYEIRRVADNAGTPDTSTVLWTSGTVTSTTARTRPVAFPDNGVTEHVQVRRFAAGLWSPWSTARVTVSYTPPPAPTVTVTAVPGQGRVEVAWTHPDPAVGQPAVIGAYVLRSRNGGPWVVLSTVGGTPYLDRTVGARDAVAYRVVAIGDNGTTATSETVPADRLELAGVWLHPATDPSQAVRHALNGQGGTRTRQASQAVAVYAGRELPFVEYGEHRTETVTAEIHVVDEAALDHLETLTSEVVSYRDGAGRRIFATIEQMTDTLTAWGWDVTLTLTAVAFDETVPT